MTAAGDFIDLDKVVATPIPVKVGSETYKLPGDAPSELLLRIIVLVDEVEKAGRGEGLEGDTPEEIAEAGIHVMLAKRQDLNAAIEELFSIEQEIDEGEIELSDPQIAALVQALFSRYYPGTGEEGGARPTGENSTPPKPKSAQRSRRNSRGAKPKAPRASASSASSPS
jgi:hypothetical protein